MKTCPICGEEFEPDHDDQEFCEDCIATEEIYAMHYGG